MKPVSYSSTGVDYNIMDPLKKMAQAKGAQTASNLSKFNIREVAKSRGESAYVWEEEDCFRAFVIEGLGTKNLVADEMQKITGRSYYDLVAQDTVAAIVNDITTVGAMPQVINAYFATGGSEWFSDQKRIADLIDGFAKACNMAGATWGGGETPTLSGIINAQTADLAGACVGIIKPKNRLIVGDKLQAGDVILLIESSGIHANGLSLARELAQNLALGYKSKLSDGTMFGQALLIPTYIYVSLVRDLFDMGVDIHYLVNITGHGWRKLMRASKDFTYLITQIPEVPPIFNFIQEHSGNDDQEMYGTFNMGAGLAIYLSSDQVEKAQEAARRNNLKSWNAGVVKTGPKQVVIQPKNITFEGKSLDLR